MEAHGSGTRATGMKSGSISPCPKESGPLHSSIILLSGWFLEAPRAASAGLPEVRHLLSVPTDTYPEAQRSKAGGS